MQKPFPGQKCGCSDSAGVDDPVKLSRVYDMLYNAELAGGVELLNAVWGALDYTVKAEFNYGNWSYVA